MKSKIETFIGFAVRARKVRSGINAVSTLKRANLIVICESISDNSKKQCIKIAKNYGCPIIQINGLLENYVHKEGVKVIAVTDLNLAKAILQDENNYHFVVDAKAEAELDDRNS